MNSTRGTGVLERVAQLCGGVALVQGDDHHARTGYRLIELEVAMAVRADNRNTLTVAEPQRPERLHEAAGALHVRVVGEPDIAAHDGGGIGRDPTGSSKRGDHRRHIEPERTR